MTVNISEMDHNIYNKTKSFCWQSK